MNAIEYDAEADALYIRVSDGKVARTQEAGQRANLDFNVEGSLVGIEVFEASHGVPEHILKQLAAA